MKRIATYRDFVGELTVTYRRTDEPMYKIKSSADAADYMRKHFDECMDDHEEFKIIHLNNANGIVNIHHHSVGGQTGTLADVKLAVRQAIHINCQAVIIMHNHPSSTLRPSDSDIATSKKFRTAFEYFDIRMLDSIIITREGYTSLADDGLI